MKKSQKQIDTEVKNRYLPYLIKTFEDLELEVLRIKDHTIAVPVLDENGDESWLKITLVVPSGSRDGEAFDGYSLQQEYEINQKKKKENAEKAKISKQKKFEKAQEVRAALKKQREENAKK
jgi:hypothetical protein